MPHFHDNALIGAAGSSGSGYKISRSLRFNAADSASLSRTIASAGDRKTWTWSGWIKRTGLNAASPIFSSGLDATNSFRFAFTANNFIIIANEVASVTTNLRITSAAYRDIAAWMHIVLAVDTTQATAANRIKLYVNGAEVTSFGTASDPALNADLFCNAAGTFYYARNFAANYADAYLAEVHFVNGLALTPSSFGATDATTEEWMPILYSGSYGTNGHKLTFSDNSAATAAALGADTGGGGNNFTPNNLSVTAGTGNDSLVDTPTSYGTDTGVGGEVRGNYCTWNSVGVSNYGTNAWPIVNGALDANDSSVNVYGVVPGTMAVSSGKWYWEVTVTTGLTAIDFYAGLGIELANITSQRYKGLYGSCYYYNGDGTKNVGTTSSAYGAAWVSGDVIGVALDLGAATVTFYRNNTSQGAISITAGEYRPVVGDFNNSAGTNFSANFGQRPFAYTAPSGFKALCDTNLPAPTIVKPSTVMDVVTYTGTGASLTPTSSLGFSPDLVWIKGRSGATDHALYDTVRGTTLDLVSNSTAAETTQAQGLTAFNSNGFTVGTLAKLNTNTATYAGWCWDAGSSTVTNTAGTISSQVRANASAGFSIVTFNGSAGTVGHGLGVVPSMIIAKARTGTYDWAVYHVSTGNTGSLRLNLTGVLDPSAGYWSNTTPTSTVFTVGSWLAWTNSPVAYCFAPVAGYSAFGSYTGNGNADGPFVYTGFRPRYLMVKRTTAATTGEWWIWDSSRIPYNYTAGTLSAQSNAIENGGGDCDFLSNGFKSRVSNTNANGNLDTYIYAAFAEFPFQSSRAK